MELLIESAGFILMLLGCLWCLNSPHRGCWNQISRAQHPPPAVRASHRSPSPQLPTGVDGPLSKCSFQLLLSELSAGSGS